MSRLALRTVLGTVLIAAAVWNIAFSIAVHSTFPNYEIEQLLDTPTGSSIDPVVITAADGSYKPLVQITKNANAKLQFCGDCSKACQNAILQHIDNLFDATNIRVAMELIGKGNSSECSPCHPIACTCHLVQPLGFDVCGPKVLRSKTFTTLPSVPSHRKMTSLSIDDYRRRSDAKENITEGPLSVYNPSIVPIPQTTKESLQNLYFPKQPMYIATFRVSDVGACGIVRDFDWRIYGANLLALVVLDQDLEILEDIILDVNNDVAKDVRKNRTRAAFEDFRPFLVGSTIFLSHGVFLLPIQIATSSTLEGFPIPSYLNHSTDLRVVIPDGKLNHTVSLVGLKTTAGKNFQFFQDQDGTAWMEFWPWQPHVMGPINMTSAYPQVADLNHKSNRTMPEDSFVTDPLPAFTKERGSSCCVMLDRAYWPKLDDSMALLLQPYDYVYLGISHARNKNRKVAKVYLSRFYVFLPEWPFDIVARSGPFCLPGADPDATEPVHRISAQYPLRIGNVEYPTCPMFHYISGMVSNEDRILVTYGILDCFSRLVEFAMRDVAKMLFTNLNTKQRVV